MVDKSEIAEHEESATDLRNKLIKRLAVAGVLVAILLGVLAFFDYLSTPAEEPEEPVFSKPVPVAPKKPVSQPVTPTTDLPEPPSTTPVAAESPPTPPPPQPVAQPSPVPEEKTESRRPAPRPENRSAAPTAPAAPAAKAPAVPSQAAPSPAVTSSPSRPQHSQPEASSPSSLAVPEERATPARASAHVIESRPAPVAAPSGVSRLFSGFLLQAGVFTSPQRAEELHAKLTLSGVPSTLETRVQVGPFSTRQEAEAAQAKLKELGVETVLVPPKGSRH